MIKALVSSYKQSLQHSKTPRSKKIVYAALLMSALYLGGWNLEPLNMSALIFCLLGYGAAKWPNSLMNKVSKRFGFVTLFIAFLASVFVLESVGTHYPEIMTEKKQSYIISSMASILLLYVISRAMFFYYFVVHVVSFNGSSISRGMKVVGLFLIVSSVVFAPFVTAFILYPCVVLTVLHVLCSSSFNEFLTHMSENKRSTKYTKPEHAMRSAIDPVDPLNKTGSDPYFFRH